MQQTLTVVLPQRDQDPPIRQRQTEGLQMLTEDLAHFHAGASEQIR